MERRIFGIEPPQRSVRPMLPANSVSPAKSSPSSALDPPRGSDDEIKWAVGDAQALPIPAARADGYCIAFGLRNVTDLQKALDEARRVLRPGGRFVCLEFSRPTTEAIRRLYDAYSFRIIPAVGAVVARDRQSYDYLVESIRRFPDQARLAALITEAGFARPKR